MYSEISSSIIDIIKQSFPELTGVFAYNQIAKVISTDRDKGIATIHPLKPDGTEDELSPEIPNVPLPCWPAPSGPTYFVPDDDELVRICYYYNDPSQPKIIECLGKGHLYGDLYFESRDGAHYEMEGNKITTLSETFISEASDTSTVKAGSSATVDGGSKATVTASEVGLSGDSISSDSGGGSTSFKGGQINLN